MGDLPRAPHRDLEETQGALGEGGHGLARTRFNRCGPLLRLGRLDEAQETLESCLEIFRAIGDLSMEAMSLSALADLWDKRGDREQAVGLARQALAVQNRLSDLGAVHLALQPGDLPRQPGRGGGNGWHWMAALIYALVIGHRSHLALAAQPRDCHAERRGLGEALRAAPARRVGGAA